MEAPRLTTRVRIVRAVISVGMIVGALVIFVALAMSRPLPGESNHGAQRIPVAVFRPSLVEVPRQWVGFGSVRALESVDVPARVGATVLEIAADAKPGVNVAKGQFLIQLDDQDFRRALEGAAQQLSALDAQLGTLLVEEDGLSKRLKLAAEDALLVRADESRAREALESGAATKREVDRARQLSIAAERAELTLQEAFNQIAPRRAALLAQVEVQRAAHSNAQASLERCRIASPIAGVLQRLDLEVGESVAPGQVVARVVDPSVIEIPVHLPASARGWLRVGDPVEYEVVGQQGSSGVGQLSRIEPEDDPMERTTTVYLEVAQPGESARHGGVGEAASRQGGGVQRIAPGAFAQATVSARDSELRMVIPRRAMRAERVLELVGGKLVQRDVAVSHAFHGAIASSGLDDLDWLVLGEALPPGVVIAIDGGRTIVPGAIFEERTEAAAVTGADSPDAPKTSHE